MLGTTVEVEHVETRVGDVRHSQADSTRLRELFPDVVPDGASRRAARDRRLVPCAVTTR